SEDGGASDAAGADARSGGAGVVIAVVARVSRAGEKVDEAVGGDHADGVIGGYRDIDVARGIHREGRRQMQAGVGGGPGIAPEAGEIDGAVAGEGGDHALGIDHADSVVQRVRDIDVTGRIQSDALRRVELRVDRRAAIARESGARIARNQRERTGGIDLEDRVTAAEIEIGAGDGQLPRLTD